MTRPSLECAFALPTGWTAEGSLTGFGEGKNSLTINLDIQNATVLRITMEGDASKVAKIEYDCNISGASFWAWVDSESTPHQVLTGLTETTNEDLTYHVKIEVNEVMDEEINMFLTYLDNYSSAQRVLSNFRVYDSNGTLLNMIERLELFVLPRLDWYDEDGRIYKDALIENFNAIESKLLAMSKLDPVAVTPPDVSGTIFPDVTLASEDDCIVNLKSLVSILGLINYPLEIKVSGSKVIRTAYFDSDYQYNVLQNKTPTSISDVNKYVYIDLSDKQIKATSNESTALLGIFLGVYYNGIIRTIHDMTEANLNLMYLLGNMDSYAGSFSSSRDGRRSFSNPLNQNRTVGFYNGESQAGSHTGNYIDYGY